MLDRSEPMSHALSPPLGVFPHDRALAPAVGFALKGHETKPDRALIMQPGHNVWRIERAARASVLIDAAPFFGALREALRNAQKSVFIVGWDIDSRTRLVGEDCNPDDGLPVTFVDFLSALVARRPDLTVHLLLWDYSIVYALERELLPTLALHWNTPRQVRLCLDNEVPVGSSHHQKIIVVDDALAFSGGLDLTIRRWDTCDHRFNNPDRVDPAGIPYRPFHDVQAMVDGDAARALGELVRARWERAGCDYESTVEPVGDPWPHAVKPDFTNVGIGIARTMPIYEEEDEIREVETLFLDSIGCAQRSIYIENQFVTSMVIAERLTQVMRERPRLETVIVTPQDYGSWIEKQTMRTGRIRFIRLLEGAGVGDRVRMFYPEVADGDDKTDTMVHSKIFIVDDAMLRIGSANLNNRSMGADSECDLAIEARNDDQREAILDIRNRLLGEHCGVSGQEMANAVAKCCSILKAAEQVSRNGHRLALVNDGAFSLADVSGAMEEVADPYRPIGADLVASPTLGTRISRMHFTTIAKIALALVIIAALPLAWQYTPLAALADPEWVSTTLAELARGKWTPLIMIGIFVVAGLVAFPVTVLIAVTAATFGPKAGFAYAAFGCLASALVGYLLGAQLGRDFLRDYLGPRLDRIRRRLVKQGVLAVATIRLVPIAPFTLINLVAGASQIRLQDYLLGTVLGMAPGLIIMSALGYQIVEIIKQPTAANLAVLAGAILGWIALSFGIQILITKFRSAES